MRKTASDSADVPIDRERRAASWALVVIGGVLTGMALPGLRRFVHGDADPFQAGLPLDLTCASVFAVLALGAWSRRPFLCAGALYAGYLGYVAAFASPEYPAATAIALGVHGLLPALSAAIVVTMGHHWASRTKSW